MQTLLAKRKITKFDPQYKSIQIVTLTLNQLKKERQYLTTKLVKPT